MVEFGSTCMNSCGTIAEDTLSPVDPLTKTGLDLTDAKPTPEKTTCTMYTETTYKIIHIICAHHVCTLHLPMHTYFFLIIYDNI